MTDDEGYATWCADCDARFFKGEEAYNLDECCECGSRNVYAVPA